jgi:hypothetical protein
MVAFEWASEIEETGSYDELAQNGAKYNPDFATMEAKVVAGVMGILPSELRRKVDDTKTVYAMKKPPQMITGREIVWRIYDYNKLSKTAHVIKRVQDLIDLELRGDNLSQYITAWDKCLLTMTNLPTSDIMESTFRTQIVKSDKLKEVMKMYNLEINQKDAKPSYESLRRMVDTYIETSRLDKAIKESDNSKKYGSVVRSAPEAEKECRHWKAKGACYRGDACAFWHDPAKKAKEKYKSSRGRAGTPKGEKGKGKDGRSPSRGRKGKGKGKGKRKGRGNEKENGKVVVIVVVVVVVVVVQL